MAGLWQRLPALAASAVIVIAGLARITHFAGRPAELITIIPDDAFYYLRLAHNRVAVGAWSFDQVSPTSGFHLLYGYLLAAAEWLFGPVLEDWQHSFVVISVLSTLAVALAAYLVVRSGQRLYGTSAAWWGLIVLVGPWTVALITMMMESPLVVLSAAVVLALAVGENRPTWLGAVGLFTIGWLAALSRVDFALWPGMLWLVGLFCGREPGARRVRLTAIFAGSVTAVATTLVHSYIWTGHLAPSSALVKLQWSLQAGTGSLAGGLGLLPMILLAFGFAAHKLAEGSGKLAFEPFSLAGAGTLVGYLVIFYVVGSRGAQPWYQALFLVPLAVSVMAVGAVVWPRLRAVSAVLLVGTVTVAGLAAVPGTLWPWQAGMYHAAQKLADRTAGQPVGSWNAGILAVVSGLQITNLDGLVDDRAAAASAQGTLYDYLRARGIEYIADTANSLIWTESGKVDPRVAQCYQRLERLSDLDDPADRTGPTTLFQLRPQCR